MQLHQSRNNNPKGFFLALTTSVMWGSLPIALKFLLPQMNSITVTWYRFSIAALFLNALLLVKNQWPRQSFTRQKLFLWLMACLGLVANHTLYVSGLNYLTPTSATVIIQLGPVMFLLSGLLVFKEVFFKIQWAGLLMLFPGMLLFFNQEILGFQLSNPDFLLGGLMVLAASISWVFYAIAQKQLLLHYTSQQIVAVIYLSGTVLLLPLSSPLSVVNMDSPRIWVVVFCGINTLIAYGCFSESLQHWPASRVGAMLSIIPALTLLLMQLFPVFFPEHFSVEPFTLGKILGTLMVVSGSMMCALGKK